jgi:hypothetical protein
MRMNSTVGQLPSLIRRHKLVDVTRAEREFSSYWLEPLHSVRSYARSCERRIDPFA